MQLSWYTYSTEHSKKISHLGKEYPDGHTYTFVMPHVQGIDTTRGYIPGFDTAYIHIYKYKDMYMDIFIVHTYPSHVRTHVYIYIYIFR